MAIWDELPQANRHSATPRSANTGVMTPRGGAQPQPTSGAEDPQTVFRELMQGKPLTLESMRAIEGDLQRRTGARLEMNARGTAADLRLPGGGFVDVVQGFEGPESGRSLQWMPEQAGGGAGTPGSGGAGLPPDYWTGYQTGGGRYPVAAAGGPGLAAPFNAGFVPPTGTDDPGFQFALEKGQQAIERSAAAKGTLLTGGTQRDLADYTTGMALQGYGDAWNRSRNQYLDAYNVFQGNQGALYNRLAGLVPTGLQAAGQYGANTAAQGNVNAAVPVAQSNAVTGALNTVGQYAPYAMEAWQAGRSPQQPTIQAPPTGGISPAPTWQAPPVQPQPWYAGMDPMAGVRFGNAR